jgi:catalase
VQAIGKLVLNANPTNFFSEVEQVAFCTGHVVPGIEFTNDPLLQGRNFSYLDTQITRLGGPNWTQIPINRPHVPVNDNHRDGFMQQGIPTGDAPYKPNSIDGGGPETADWSDGAYINVPRPVEGEVVRGAPVSFDDHFSQAAMFYASLSDVEKTHVTEAYTFELGKVYEQAVKERQLTVLAKIDSELCAKVAAGLGLPVPDGKPVEHRPPSPALAQVKGESFPIDGRQVGVVAGPDADLSGIDDLRKALEAAGAQVKVIAPHGGTLGKSRHQQIVERTIVTARSVEFDAVVVADGAPKDNDIKSVVLLQEAYRLLKPFAAWGDGVEVLTAAGIDPKGPGVLTGKTAKALAADLVTAMGQHKVWARADLVTASAVAPAR